LELDIYSESGYWAVLHADNHFFLGAYSFCFYSM